MTGKAISHRWTVIRVTTLRGNLPLIASYTWFLALIALVLLPACSSTHIKTTLNPTGITAGPIRNVTVVGMDERLEFRNPFENDAVAFLKKHGVEGVGSHARFSLDEMKGDPEQIRQRLVASKAESVLFVHVTDKTDFGSGPPASLGSLDMAAVDESRYNLATPGGQVDTKLRLAARLYRVSDGATIWSGQMDTIVKEDYDSVVLLRGVAKTIVDRMAKDRVIP